MNEYSRTFTKTPKVTILAFFLSCSGCDSIPLNHIGAFSKASADLATTTAKGYEIINNSTIDRRLSDIASESNRYPDGSTFKEIIADSNLATRIKLLKGVESYAKALGDLASADFRKDIDAASKDLYGSFGELQKTYSTATKAKLPLAEGDLAIIATAVDAIGTAIAEDRRRTALQVVIIQSDPAIQKAMELISEEIPGLSEFTEANLNRIFVEKVKAYQHESGSLTFEQRITELNKVRKAYELKEATSGLFNNLINSSKKIAEAHAALRDAVKEEKFTSNELITDIKELVAFAKSTKEFHEKITLKSQ